MAAGKEALRLLMLASSRMLETGCAGMALILARGWARYGYTTTGGAHCEDVRRLASLMRRRNKPPQPQTTICVATAQALKL